MNITPTKIVKNRFLRTAFLGCSIAIGIQVYSVQKDVNQIVASTDNKAQEHHLEEVRKYFPDNLKGDEFMEKFSTLEGTIRAYEDIIQNQDDPVRTKGMELIDKQNIEIEELASGMNKEEGAKKIYTKFRENLAELLLFIENNIPKESQQCRNPNITV